MKQKKKLKYEKPESMDIGKAAAVLGAICSYGNLAADGCNIGDDPDVQPYCPQGNVATGNCHPVGGTAGASCHDGGSPGW
ncbi:MAG: hypothetical protein K8R67_04485 [Desulfobacteraceae bacterium]|nr:hypothetical protein [Desulfobacteraceae bacterium]